MRLATLELDGTTQAARIEDDEAVLLDAADVGRLLRWPDWRVAAAADGIRVPAGTVRFAQLVAAPSKTVCVGLNYRRHIDEIGLPTPAYPTLFAKFAEALAGPYDDLELPAASDQPDWEAELTVVIGQRVRRAGPDEAAAAIAGFTVANDVSMRDVQTRTSQWLQGKTFQATTPLGPVLVTPDELPGGLCPDLEIGCRVNGETMQLSRTSDLLFTPVDLVAYVSEIVALNPGDLILTGTPGGVGAALDPPRFLATGDVMVTTIEGIGSLRNRIVAAA